MFSEFVIRSPIWFLILCLMLCATSGANDIETCSVSLSNNVMHAIPQNDTPILAVLGKTRAGKGELIRTAVHFLTGEELDIASSGMLSQTRTAKGYPASFRGTEIMFYDTVGFGDSDCTNLAEETLLRMLEATGTQPFYPPLYILKDLDSTNIDALRKLTSIFPEVCVAVRGSDEMFNSAAKDFEAVELDISKFFHLPEFVTAVPQTKELYNGAVNATLAGYASFTPTRRDLKFDSELFVGQVEKVKVNTETKYEDVVSEEGYTATETQIIIKERVESVLTGYRTEKRSTSVGSRIARGGRKKTVQVPVYTPVTIKDEVPVSVQVARKKVTTTRFSHARDINQVYKVLTGNIRIYMTNEIASWTQTGQEVINVQDVKA